MPSNLMQYKVFLGLTKNLEKEREKFHEVLREFSQEKEELGLSFKPVDYLQIPGDCGRPQEIINEEINRSDYAVFVLYDNLGSDAGGEAKKTGIEEEWEYAQELWKDSAKNMRNRALFFRIVDEERLQKPDDELKKVQEFRRKIEEEREIIYKEYKDITQFEEELKKCLKNWRKKQNFR